MIKKNECGGTFLEARAADLTRRAADGIPVCWDFLSPADQQTLVRAVNALGEHDRLLLWGGYADAERKKAFFLPDHLMPVPGDEEMPELIEVAFGNPLAALELSGSGYRELTNRDWLGAVLNLGLERAALGDLRTADAETAFLICERPAAQLLLSELERVGRDAVRVREIGFFELWERLPAREFLPVSDTVPAARLDAVVGALCRIAREKAKLLVLSGAVQRMGEPLQKPDAEVAEGDILSVRGYGKFRILSVSEKNKKGRLRLSAEKYV